MGDDPRAWDDLTLAKRCVSREEAAWKELLRRLGPAVHGMMWRVFRRAGVPDPVREAGEALGDLALALLEKDAAALRAYHPPSSLQAYLAVIARNLALNLLRKRHTSLPLRYEEAVSQPGLPEDPPVTSEQLARGLEALQPRERLLLQLVHMEGLSYARAAALLGVPEVQMGPLLSRARAALRKALEENQ